MRRIHAISFRRTSQDAGTPEVTPFTSFPLREIPVPDTRIYDIQPGERGRDLRAERIEIVSGLLLPFYVYHKETRKKITFEEYKALSREQQQEYNVIPTYKYYSVFNLDQTNFSDVRPEEWEALREKFRGGQAEQPDGTTGEAHPEIDAMLEAKSWFCPIREQQGDRAFYSPLADYIVVPLRSQFVDMQSFYETLLHEMGHSTGHPTRLNRDLAHPFGSEEYGKEELTAEFAAALAGMFFGIAEHIRTENAAYLKSWIKAIREEPKFILNVLADAMKIVKMIAGKLNISVESEETAADEAEQVA